MAEDGDKFDAIIIGGGFAGVATAHRLAQSARSVLVIERGPSCGAKTFTGGRIYAYALKKLLGDEWKDAPVQREVTREIIVLPTDRDATNVDTTLNSVNEESYTVLSTPLIQWLAERVEEAGAMIITGSTVEGLIIRDGRVCGVRVRHRFQRPHVHASTPCARNRLHARDDHAVHGRWHLDPARRVPR